MEFRKDVSVQIGACSMMIANELTRVGAITLILMTFFLTQIAAQDTFQLAPPYLRYQSVFFKKQAHVAMEFAQPGTRIHYSINSLGPTEKDSVYSTPISLKNNADCLTARVFGDGFFPSEIVWARFFKQGFKIKSASTTPPQERYPGNGKQTLIDGQGGITAYKSNTWMGFQTEEVTVFLTLKKSQKATQVLLHLLQDQDAWIFLPCKMEVYGAKKGAQDWIFLGAQEARTSTVRAQTASCQVIITNIAKPVKVKKMMLKITPVLHIPDWHPGKGKLAWIFMDEIIVY